MDDADMRRRPTDEVVAEFGVARAIGLKHVASLLFTYRCSIACRHCLFSCTPTLPDHCVGLADGVNFLRQLRAVDRVVHIAGGEAMLYWPRLEEIVATAAEVGAAPHFFETNAGWCLDDDVTRGRMTRLRELGVRGVLISADPYHQAFVPPERRLRAYRLAVAVYGRENVIAADLSLEQLRELRAVGRDEDRLKRWTLEHPPRLTGRAGDSLARWFPDRAVAELADDPLWHGAPPAADCRAEFDPAEMWEIHIDPYGNVRTCCGIIVGNVHETPLAEQMARGFKVSNPLVAMVWERGPSAYVELASQYGYQPRTAYKQKCEMCWDARRVLREHYPETFGPAEVYPR